MQRFTSFRVMVGMFLIVLVPLLSNIELMENSTMCFRKLGVKYRLGKDYISRNEKRFDELKKLLPVRGVIGYIYERGRGRVFVKAERKFLLTQYSMAPLIIVRSDKYDLVIGNQIDIAKIPKHLVLQKDLGNDILFCKGITD